MKKKKIEKRRAAKKKAAEAKKAQEANFELDLPSDFDEDSSDDDSIVTVVSPREGVRKVQDENTVQGFVSNSTFCLTFSQ